MICVRESQSGNLVLVEKHWGLGTVENKEIKETASFDNTMTFMLTTGYNQRLNEC